MSATFYTLDELGLQSGHGSHEVGDCARGDCDRSSTSVLEINDLATLAELQPLWRELLAQTPRPAFCQTFEWLQLYLQHFGEGRRLRAFYIEEQGEVSGLAVLIEQSRDGRRELALPSVGSETLLPLGAHPERTWRAVGQHLQHEFTRKHVLDLPSVCDENGIVAEALRAEGLKIRVQSCSGTTCLHLGGDDSSFWSNLSPSLRAMIESAEQQFSAIVSPKFVRLRPTFSEQIDLTFPAELYDDCLHVTLNDETQMQSPGSVLNDPARHAFLRDLLPWAWRYAAADLCLLMTGSRPIAFRFHTHVAGRLQTVWTGVDAEYRRIPLATVLLHRTLRDSLERGDAELDLGSTQPEFAFDWNGEFISRSRIVIGPSASNTSQPQEMMQHGD